MKKKALSILTGIAVTMSLVACGQDTTGNETQTTPAATTVEGNEEGQENNTEITEDNTENPSATETSDESRIGNIADGYDETKDYIGIIPDGCKTEVSVYNNYDNVGSPEDYLEGAEAYALDYLHSNGYPEFKAEDFLSHKIYDRLEPYIHLEDDWKGSMGKSWCYRFYYEEMKWIPVQYDPRLDTFFIDNQGLNYIGNTVLADKPYTLWFLAGCHFVGYVDDEVSSVEQYVDFEAALAYITGVGEIAISEDIDFEGSEEYSDLLELLGNYGELKKIETADHQYELKFTK